MSGAAAGIMLGMAACTPYGWLALRRPPRWADAQLAGAGALACGAATTAAASAGGGAAVLLLAATTIGAGLGLCFATAARTVFGLARAFGGGLLTAWYASTYLGVGSAVVGVGLLSTVTSLTGSVRAVAATVTAATIGWLAAALGGRASRRS